MFIALLLLLTIIADIWLSWAIGGLAGIGVFFIALPVSIFLLIGGAIALGLMGMIFGRPDDRTKTRRFISAFLRGWAGLTALVWLMPWILFGIVHTTNTYFPATLPRITLTNGEKTVIFQSMMHIASPEFYGDIERDMESLESQDYVFFYEGVRLGTPDSVEKLSKLMGSEISENMYDLVANIAGLRFQGDVPFETILPSINVDLSTDEIVALAEKNNITPAVIQGTDMISDFKEHYPSLSGTQKYIIQVLSRGMMNVLLMSYTQPELLTQLQGTMPVIDVILTERNKNLAKTITESPSERIYVHYGALHFEGLLSELQKSEPQWQEIARSGFTVIRN